MCHWVRSALCSSPTQRTLGVVEAATRLLGVKDSKVKDNKVNGVDSSRAKVQDPEDKVASSGQDNPRREDSSGVVSNQDNKVPGAVLRNQSRRTHRLPNKEETNLTLHLEREKRRRAKTLPLRRADNNHKVGGVHKGHGQESSKGNSKTNNGAGNKDSSGADSRARLRGAQDRKQTLRTRSERSQNQIPAKMSLRWLAQD